MAMHWVSAALQLMRFGVLIFAVLLDVLLVSAYVRHYDFTVKEVSYTRLCNTKNILTVNGEFPGPTIKARRGDTVIVRVHNQGGHNVTLHWHGVDQPRNPWSDGPEYITQCPVKPGANFTYKILLSKEEGTLWWHAHSDWSRSTVYGAIVIHPKRGNTFPFPTPYKEVPILLGEWWNRDVQGILEDILLTGRDAPISDAHTINGQPGDLYPCSKPGTFNFNVEHGKTYLLRVINAALADELFFAVAGHQLTVVGTDGGYTKPFTTDYIMITPGQTMDLLLEANPITVDDARVDRYYMAARPYSTADGLPFDNTTTTAVLQYHKTSNSTTTPLLPTLPFPNDTAAATAFTDGLRSLASNDHPVDVPDRIGRRIVIAIAMSAICPNNSPCTFDNFRLSASLNNVSFVTPSSIDVLRAYDEKIEGVFGTEFPARPPTAFDFTSDGLPRSLWESRKATEVRVLEYGEEVEVVLQGTNVIAGENHPMHLHGYGFYVVGRGFGNFDERKDPLEYNLVDPLLHNTVGVPKSGWAAIRFRATNPGVWFLHCHLERHSTWGMATVFIVKDGTSPDSQMLPPPPDMPPC